MEKTNIRYLTSDQIKEEIAFASIDVSFISLTKVLQPVRDLLRAEGEIVCLIKPQFEAGREKVGKKGVVRDHKVHEEVIELVSSYASSIGFDCLNLDFSPIKGPEGNIEYLLYLKKLQYDENIEGYPVGTMVLRNIITKVVNEAHGVLSES
jgi:23S rRNA (cytidine1920-2'-O)/16S rRNA (cytidine1409-2'-O)-methyltransferase